MARSSTTWAKGKSGNPHGRPKGEEQFVSVLRERLNRKIRGVSAKVRLADILIGLSLAGDTRAAGIIVNTLRGSWEFVLRQEEQEAMRREIAELKERLEEVKDAKRD